METSVLRDEQKRQWKEDGYLVLEGVLSSEEIKNLTATIDQMYAEHLQQPDVKPDAGLNQRNAMEDNDIFVELMDHLVTFPVVLELMGPYIQLSMSQGMIRPSNPETKGLSHALHADGGQAMRQIRVSESSLPLQIKLQYFLTDLPAPDYGNFTVVPGSHNIPFPEEQLGVSESHHNSEAVQLCVKAGDAAVFTHALWHGAAANRFDKSRKTLIYCYNHHCLRAYDYDKASPELLARCTPRQQRLLGDIGEWHPGSYFYSPSDQVEVITGGEEKT
jgi:ectoine hydroxylase-related dioxygenase (phytanoyl-CoA dioxygenase family)